MNELQALVRWHEQGIPAALATVLSTSGSSPRQPGSLLAISSEGQFVGSVSSGCVEAHVLEAAAPVWLFGHSLVLEFEKVQPDDPWSTGLSCGGSIRVRVEPNPLADPLLDRSNLWLEAISCMAELSQIMMFRNFTTGQDFLARNSAPVSGVPAAIVQMAAKQRGSFEASADGENWFVQRFGRSHRMAIVGASHIGIALVSLTKVLGIRSIVVEPRESFADPARFETAPDALILEWPDHAMEKLELDSTWSVIVLSHDDKIDVPAVACALRHDVGYIGLLGSVATQALRRDQLAKLGFCAEQLERIRGPVGLAIGAKTPEEIALSIAAEVVQWLHE